MQTYSVLEEGADLTATAPLGPRAGGSAAAFLERARPAARIGSHAEYAGERSGSNLVRFWELRGRKVIHHDGVAWGAYKGSHFTSLPFHLQLDLERSEIDALLRKHRLWGIRYRSANQPGTESGLYVCNRAGYGMQSVHRTLRAGVAQGLDACVVRDMDPWELERAGIELNRDTMARQKRKVATFLEEDKWREFLRAVSCCPGMQIHGAYVGRRLTAYLISCREGEWLHLMYKMSRTDSLEVHPNHALDFTVVRDSGPGIRWIANGFTAVGGHDGLDRYKRDMGYEVKKHNVCVHLHPAIAPLALNRVTIRAAKKASVAMRTKRMEYAAMVLEGAAASRNLPKELSELGGMREQEEAGMFSRLKKGGVRNGLGHGADFVRRGLGKITAKRVDAVPGAVQP